jgi:uncharacterized protein (TIGR03435 family)
MRRTLLALGAVGSRSRLRGQIEALLVRGRQFSASVSLARVGAGAAVLLALALAASLAPRWIALAQTPDNAPNRFEVASVRLNTTAANRSSTSFLPGGRFSARFTTLDRQVVNAYRIKDYQLSGGPRWVYSERYDIEAKAEGNPSRDQMRMMLQGLLAERFHLVIHRETRELPIYALVVGKQGAKLQESPDRPTSGINVEKGKIAGQGATVTELADQLSRIVDRLVFNKTGIKGFFDFSLEYSPMDTQSSDAPLGLADVLTAIQEQLGLKLQPDRARIEVLVIDGAEKPGEN